jgi:hypothetical protein
MNGSSLHFLKTGKRTENMLSFKFLSRKEGEHTHTFTPYRFAYLVHTSCTFDIRQNHCLHLPPGCDLGHQQSLKPLPPGNKKNSATSLHSNTDDGYVLYITMNFEIPTMVSTRLENVHDLDPLHFDLNELSGHFMVVTIEAILPSTSK